MRFGWQSWMAVGLLLAAPLAAQDESRGMGYVSFGVTTNDICDCGSGFDVLSVGGGGEGFLYKGLSLGGDLHYAFPRRDFGAGIGLLSVGPAYHFSLGPSAPVVPFVGGGYGLAFRGGTANLYYLGGGVTWWMKRSLGLRVEFRHHRSPDEGSLSALRVSLAFR
ncbi:MAG: hypothetical protein IT158_05920 [Bryobacterales bacterium]|nr:hypothetical protein [Bryobacterales bacterium]